MEMCKAKLACVLWRGKVISGEEMRPLHVLIEVLTNEKERSFKCGTLKQK